MRQSNRTVPVANFRTKMGAEMAAGLLQEREIPYVIQSTEGILHGPIMPGATILVPASAVEEARQILADANMLSDAD
jgi:Putative prokaryotic signal transducing protein